MKPSNVLVVVFAILWSALARGEPASPWVFAAPTGYTKVDGPALDTMLDGFKHMASMRHVDGHIYDSPDHAVHLVVVAIEAYDSTAAAPDDLEVFDRQFAAGADEVAGTTHISDSKRVVGNQLHVTSIDDRAGNHTEWRRIYGVDLSSHLVHVLSVMCIGPADQLAPCKQSQDAMRVVLDEPSPPPPAPPVPSPHRQWVWWGFLGAVVACATIWVITTARTSGRRRRR